MFVGSEYECYKRRLMRTNVLNHLESVCKCILFLLFFFLVFLFLLLLGFSVCFSPKRTIYAQSWKLAVIFSFFLETLFRFLLLVLPNARFAIETFSFVVPKQIPYRFFMFSAYLARFKSIYVHIYRSTRKIAAISAAVRLKLIK